MHLLVVYILTPSLIRFTSNFCPHVFVYVLCKLDLCGSKTKDFANENWENSNYWDKCFEPWAIMLIQRRNKREASEIKFGREKNTHKKKQHKTKWSCFIHSVKHFSSTLRQTVSVRVLKFMNACSVFSRFVRWSFCCCCRRLLLLLLPQFTVWVFIVIVATSFSSSYCLATVVAAASICSHSGFYFLYMFIAAESRKKERSVRIGVTK